MDSGERMGVGEDIRCVDLGPCGVGGVFAVGTHVDGCEFVGGVGGVVGVVSAGVGRSVVGV